MGARLEVEPVSALADEPVSIRVLGLAPAELATLRLATLGWESSARFEADPRGEVDLATQAPVTGSYSGCDAMGLFWSLKSASPGLPSPLMSPLPDRLELSLEVDGSTLARRCIERLYAAPGVTRREVRDDGLFGVLYEPRGSASRPAVLLLSGSGGGLSESGAALLASRGFAAFALAYFNYGPLQDDLCEIPLEYFETALQWLGKQPRIDPSRLAVRGVSRGGELALLLGATFPEIRAVIAVVPSSVCWGSVSGNPDRLGLPSWTHGGKPVACCQRVVLPAEREPGEGKPIALTPGFLEALKDLEAARASEIPVERINGSVLLISGDDDEMWPSAHFSERVMARLERQGFPHAKTHLSYEGAGHRVGLPPFQPTTAVAGFHPVRKALFSFGGTPRAYAAANEDAWRNALQFLRVSLT